MALDAITDDVFAYLYETRAGGVRFSCRSTVVGLEDGLLIVSPGPIDDALADEIAARGDVAHILAPNLFHHLNAKRAVERFSAAALWSAPGLSKKLRDDAFSQVLSEPNALGSDLTWLRIGGSPKLQESVLLHGPSRTLIVSDLMYNVNEATFLTRISLRMIRAYGGPRMSRMWKYYLAKDRRAVTDSIEEVLAWDFDRLVVGHGDVIETGAKDVLARATAWLRALAH